MPPSSYRTMLQRALGALPQAVVDLILRPAEALLSSEPFDIVGSPHPGPFVPGRTGPMEIGISSVRVGGTGVEARPGLPRIPVADRQERAASMARNFGTLYGMSEEQVRQSLIRGRTADLTLIDDLLDFRADREHVERQIESALGLDVYVPLQVSQIVPPPPPPRAAESEAAQRAQRLAAQIAAEEDQRIFDALDTIASEGFEPPPRTGPTFFEPSFVTAPADPRAVVRSLTREDLVSVRERIERHPIPPGTVVALSDPEFVGRIPVRQELTVLPADEPRQVRLGFSVSERVGRAVVNPRAVEQLQGRRVMVPEFEIASNPTVRLDDIRQRRFDLIDRTGWSEASQAAASLWFAVVEAKVPPLPSELPTGYFEEN